MTYPEALTYIQGINTAFCKPGLERTYSLCHALGDPQEALRFIHIAGTNGKGSTLAMLESILLAAGYSVGVFSSPAVRDFCEQIRADGKAIEEKDLADLVTEAAPVAEGLTDKPTSFELLTALAFLYFKRQGCDIVLLEAGLGGRLDATNVVKTTVLSVITGIALEHTAFLGDTVEAIAGEKAGIIKPRVPVLFGGEDASAREVIEAKAKALHAPFYAASHDKLLHIRPSLDGTLFDYGEHRDLSLSLLGLYQPKNAATVLEAVRILNQNGFSVPETAVRAGLSRTVWHARFEVLSRDPLVIYDGAHNPNGIAEAVRSIKAYFGEQKIVLLSGVLRDKDYTEIADMLALVTLCAFTVTPDSPRALSAKEYAEALRARGIDALPAETVADGVEAALERAKKEQAPLVCLGSLYLYKDVLLSNFS